MIAQIMTSIFHIRDATLSDLHTVVEYNQRMAEETEGKRLSLEVLEPGVRAALSDPARGRYFLACLDEEVLGQLMLTTEWSDWRNGHIWWIQSVYVPSSHRRRGVFRSLYRHVEKLARATEGVAGLRLYVENNNVVAQRVYESLGMSNAGYAVFESIFLVPRQSC